MRGPRVAVYAPARDYCQSGLGVNVGESSFNGLGGSSPNVFTDNPLEDGANNGGSLLGPVTAPPDQRSSNASVFEQLRQITEPGPGPLASSDGSTGANASAATTLAKTAQPPQSQPEKSGSTTLSNLTANSGLEQTINSYQESYNKAYTAAKKQGAPDAKAASRASEVAKPYQQKLEAGNPHYDKGEQAAYRDTYNATYKAATEQHESEPNAVAKAARAGSEAADETGLLNRLHTQVQSTKDPAIQAKLQQAYKDMSYALISNDVYNDTSIKSTLPPGVSRVESPQELAKLGLKQSDLQTKGLYSAVYHDSNSDTYVIANRGTSNKKDIWEDYVQSQGWTKFDFEYKSALGVARAVMDAKNAGSFSGNVEFTGHSLGGGLAAAQALFTGFRATTFDAAGLSGQTISDYKLNKSNEKNITAVNNGDALTQAQTHPMVMGAVTVTADLAYVVYGVHMWMTDIKEAAPAVLPLRQPPPPAVGQSKPLTSVTLPTRNDNGSIEFGKPLTTTQMVTYSKALHGVAYNISAIAYEAGRIADGSKQ